jgi:hypothetical protein
MTSTMRFDKWENTLGQPYGTVLQVVQAVDVNITTISNGGLSTFNSYTGLDLNVTPKLPDSKFLLTYQINLGTNGGSVRGILKIGSTYYGTTTQGTQRASTNSMYLAVGVNPQATIYGLTGQYLFQNTGLAVVSPTFEIFKQDASPVYVNRSHTYDDTERGRPASTLTVMEIAG